ncbi:MAG: hypothetical protein DDT31_00216 [Syntrophomonadaceae bacterium]|nr:hypothetical protein [Bacillota bacterium]
MSEFPFEFGEGEVYQFTSQIAIPVYGSPTVEELLFIQKLQDSKDQLSGLVTFAAFFINSRCGLEVSEAQLAKYPVKKLNKLMEFFNQETQSMSAGDEEPSKNAQTGALSIGDSNSITQEKNDLVESNSGVAL